MRQLAEGDQNKLGWMEPVFYGVVDGEPLGVFTPEQMDRIQAGYACPKCWQQFEMIFTKCPVCQLDLTKEGFASQVREFPEEWKPGPDDDRIMQPLRRAKT